MTQCESERSATFVQSTPASGAAQGTENELDLATCDIRVIGTLDVCEKMSRLLSKLGFVNTGLKPVREGRSPLFRLYMCANVGNIKGDTQ